MEHQERLRDRYRPAEVRVLFVGESPPANCTFFYQGDSGLWRYTCEAFGSVYGAQFDEDGFCEFFKSKSCYLIDLCLSPVNGMSRAERRRACEASVESLAKRMSLLSPQAVVCVKKSIVSQVELAMAGAGLREVPLHELPFPSCGHQLEYVSELARLLEAFKASRLVT